MKKSFLTILIVISTLIACTSQAEMTSLPTPEIESTIQTPSSTSLPSYFLTGTAKPTSTTTSTPEPSPTIPQTTLVAITTLESLIQSRPELKTNWSAAISPNGKWAQYYIYDQNQNILKLIEINSDKQWDVNFFDIYGERYGYESRSVGSVSVVYWSKDGNYVYLEPHPEWDGPGLWFGSGATLIRYNLNNGTWADLNVGGSWSISPNEKYIVYILLPMGFASVHFSTALKKLSQFQKNLSFLGNMSGHRKAINSPIQQLMAIGMTD